MTARDRDNLLSADPVGLTQREMLLRLDARMETFEVRMRVVEDEQLTGKVERKTIRGLLLGALAAWPVIAFLLINVVHINP